MFTFAPVVMFAYKRVRHLREAINSLRKNPEAEQTELIIYSDAPKTHSDRPYVQSVRSYIQTIHGFKNIRVIEAPENKGLANSIIEGVTDVLNEYGKVIVMEDDIVVAPFFLGYMNEALMKYQDTMEVASIHGYTYPVDGELPETFFIRGADCWGWATWSRAWREFRPDGVQLLQELTDRKLLYRFDYDGATTNVKMLRDQIAGRVDSWAIRWHASAFLKNMLTLYPGRSLVQNIGADGGGTHTANTGDFVITLTETPVQLQNITVQENEDARKLFIRRFEQVRTNKLRIYKQRMLRLFGEY